MDFTGVYESGTDAGALLIRRDGHECGTPDRLRMNA
jgi:hypothetical protein